MKLGIVGSGMIVHDLMTFIHEVKGIELVHISGTKRSEDKLKELKEKHGFLRYSTNYQELLDDKEVETIYVALPNSLHYQYTKEALLADKNVILEKPMTSTIEEAKELVELAKTKHLFLWEAITNQYLPQYHQIRKEIEKLGDIKIVQCNFSQYSSRYDAFKEGIIQPAFDINKSGGALMDLNIYNIHFVVGLFGKPENIEYYPNIENNIDTSGILILQYPHFQCVCIGAKDCKAPLSNQIQGTKGTLIVPTPVGIIGSYRVEMNDGQTQNHEYSDIHRMYPEFVAFEKMYQQKDYEQCYKMLEHSLIVTDIQTTARRKAHLFFPADQKDLTVE